MVSGGSSCHSASAKASAVLLAMGVDEKVNRFVSHKTPNYPHILTLIISWQREPLGFPLGEEQPWMM